MHVDTPSAAVT